MARLDRYLLALAALGWLIAVAALVPLGYGLDNDSYRMLATWQTMVHEDRYVASRYTGYIVSEFAFGFGAWLGGAWLANLTAAACATAAMPITWLLARKLGVARPELVVALVLATPWIMIASARPIDHMITYLFLVSGMVAVLYGRVLPGVLLLAIAAGSRMQVLLYGMVFLWMVARSRPETGLRRWEALPALLLITGLFYLPVWISHGLSLDWLTAAWIDEQGLAGLAARMALKWPRLFGLVPCAVAAILAMTAWRKVSLRESVREDFALRLSFTMCLLGLLIYFRLPTDISFSIYMVPFVAVLLERSGAVLALRALVLGSLMTALVDLEPLTITAQRGDACGHLVLAARIDPHLAKGPVLTEWSEHPRGDACYRAQLPIPYVRANDPLP